MDKQDNPISSVIANLTTANNNKSKRIDYERHCFNVDDFQKLSKKVLPKDLYEYLSSGSDDEQTLYWNRRAFQDWFLRPRMMRPLPNNKPETHTKLFGRTVSMPIFCSPAGVHALVHPKEGECATAKACRKAGILFGLSQHSTRSIEQVAEAVNSHPSKSSGEEPPLWYQAYILKDRSVTERLLRRAIKAGYEGIFLTVDSIKFGYREADARNGFDALPKPHRLANYDEQKTLNASQVYNGREEKSWDQNSEQLFDGNVSWSDIRWIKNIVGSNIPLVVKGIMTREDALLAIEAGADGIMVSNHGGRQLDGAFASIDVLPEISKAVAGRVPIFLDGGIRRGTVSTTYETMTIERSIIFNLTHNY